MLWSPRSMQKEEDVVIGADIADTEVEVGGGIIVGKQRTANKEGTSSAVRSTRTI